MMQPWKTLSRQTILRHSEYLRVEEHEVQLPDGRIIPDWPWVITPDFVNVVAVSAAGEFLFFRQTKYSVAGVSLAPVGGYLDPGEDPLATAQRELLEETGCVADDWLALGSFPVDGNRGCGVAHFYLAQNARRVAEILADDLEEQELLLLSRPAVEAALDAGAFKLVSWTAVVALALRQMTAV